jgi:hypothetical protein
MDNGFQLDCFSVKFIFTAITRERLIFQADSSDLKTIGSDKKNRLDVAAPWMNIRVGL